MTDSADNHGGLEVAGLSVGAGGQALLTGVSVRLGRGERVALRGPSGCGKTTLLRAVAGLDEPLEGELRLGGRTPGEIGYPAYRRRVAYVHQRPVLLDESVRENLARPFRYATAGGARLDEALAADLLGRLGVGTGRQDQDARSLSIGQQQRVCVIRALLTRPDVLLLDEPTSALDPEAVESVETLLAEQARQDGLAALIVTHDTAQIDRWCDRKVELADHMTAAAGAGEGDGDAAGGAGEGGR